LLERLLADGDEDDGVRAKIILGGGLDILGQVAGLGEVDESLVVLKQSKLVKYVFSFFFLVG
jgi:hypothetical protein